MTLLQLAAPRELWYLTRGAGAVTLVGLTGTTTLGILETLRWRPRRSPRFVLDALHRNLALVTVCVLGIHVLTSVLDGFAPIGLLDAVIPFTGHYRPLYLGLGALALDGLVAVGITSVLRGRLGLRAWRAVHWTAYAVWPVAMVHALGSGSDAHLGWMLLLGLACLAVVLGAVALRIAASTSLDASRRIAVCAGLAAATVGVAVWAAQGPLARGWARRAGTPAQLLGTSSLVVARVRPATPSEGFTATLSGTVRKSVSPNGSQAVVDLPLTLSGARTGALDVRLVGQPLAGGGISLSSGTVRLHVAGAFRGRVTSLRGSTLDALVRSGDGQALGLRIALSLDRSNGASGTVRAMPVAGSRG